MCVASAHAERPVDTARRLYREVASRIPFCVVSHRRMSDFDRSERPCANLTEWWIRDNETRQKLMLSCGVPLTCVQGGTSDYEAFRAFCSIMPQLVGHPLYEESHWELRRLFGCDLTIGEDTCERIWGMTSERFLMGDFTPASVWKTLGVKRICSVCYPWEDLSYTERSEGWQPVFCPDGEVGALLGSATWLERVSRTAEVPCTDWESLCAAMVRILDGFEGHGCRTAYHSLGVDAFERPHVYGADRAVRAVASGSGTDTDTMRVFSIQLLRFLMNEYARRGWTVELCVADSAVAEELFSYAKRDRGWVWSELILSSATLREDARVGVLCSRLLTEIPGLKDGGAELSEAWDAATLTDLFYAYAARTAPGGYPGLRSSMDGIGSVWQQEQLRWALCRVAARWLDGADGATQEADIVAFLERVCFQNAIKWTSGTADCG